MNFFDFFFFGILMSIVFFIFYLNFTMYSIIFLLFIYFLVFVLFFNVGVELLGLFLLMVYVGGVLVIFLFLMFLIGSNININNKKFNNISSSYLLLLFLYMLLLLIFWFFVTFFGLYVYNFDYSLTAQLSVIFKYNLLKPCLHGFDTLYYFLLSFRFYTKHYLPVILTFILFLLGLFFIISMTKNFGSLRSLTYLAFLTNRNNLSFINFSLTSIISSLVDKFLDEITSSQLYLSMTGDLSWLTMIFYLSTFSYILSLACLPLIFNNFNFIKFLIWVEITIIMVCCWLLYFSYLYSDVDGILLILLIFGIFAVETVLGLILFSNYKFKKHA